MTSKSVLAVVSDLMFVVKIGDAAKRAGVSIQFVSDAATVADKAAAGVSLILIDLNHERAKPVELIHALKSTGATATIPVVGFVSHVNVELRRKAEEAGCDRVLARSVLSDTLPKLLGDPSA